MKQLLFIIFLFCWLITKSQDSTYTKNWDNGEKRFEHFFSNGNKVGIWNNWNDKGELIEKSIYRNDTLTSRTSSEYYSHTKNLLFEIKEYNSQKILTEQRTYQSNDSESYVISSFHDNGKLKSKGRIIKKEKNGKWSYYNENGELKEIVKHKPEKEITEAQKSKQIAKTNKNYKKGHYVTSTGEKVFGYFDRTGYNKLLYKSKPENRSKGKLLDLNGITKITMETKEFTVIDSINLKLCSPFYQVRSNLILENRVQGEINVFSYSFACNSGGGMMMGANGMMTPNSTGVSTDREVFIIRKTGTKKYIEVKKRRKLFRELMKELMKDKPKTMIEINVEEIDHKNLIHIIRKYNSSKN